ncbi:hypothetical protein PR001_g28280 [Phytophthora rubi]|uniref:Uncharacterized protein n=1 Tax=Phytophthora rubi TaxID=129364 RepID=A0A6A3HDE6_9STRA|nr:hypothetical protein PR001_g28280 [Phytophthora rubi]
MSGFLDALFRWQATYVPAELLPAYCVAGIGFVFVWVVSTPVRNVGWQFSAEVWRVASLNGALWNDCLRHYNAVLANPEVRQLRGLAYVYALRGTIFAVPMQVLTQNEQKYGDYGRMLRHWWVAAYTTFYEYVPDLGLKTARSVNNYARATKDAAVSSRRRIGEALHVTLLICKFVASLAFFLPMALYTVVEYVLLGETGVALAVFVVNLANHYFEWTRWSAPGSVLFVTVGVITHIWRCGSGDTELERLSPTTIVLEGLKEVRERAATRERTETEDLQRLQGPQGEALPSSTGRAEFVRVEVVESPSRAPAAISAELRATEERSALLRLELAQHPDVRRVRRTCSRGGCPVPGQDGVVPGDRVLGSEGVPGGSRTDAFGRCA